jgi:hypothetical protein
MSCFMGWSCRLCSTCKAGTPLRPAFWGNDIKLQPHSFPTSLRCHHFSQHEVPVHVCLQDPNAISYRLGITHTCAYMHIHVYALSDGGAGRRFPTPDCSATHLSRSNEQLLVSKPTNFSLVCIALAFWSSLDIERHSTLLLPQSSEHAFSFHHRLFDSSECTAIS